MPYASNNDVHIYYEERGSGYPLVWCHEFAGSHESWEQQLDFFPSIIAVLHSMLVDILHLLYPSTHLPIPNNMQAMTYTPS